MELEKIGVSTDWLAVIIALILCLLVKFGLITNIPW
ncbi:hypothetical protein BX659_10473 [Orenia metallireducens]|uniref:Uncharacterized protein n=1 Tax=Orenia metallireducens TaxID=1413210 RepID=A0A285GCE9_9FIRM|nr:hypothetical protein BX659_10473 [Orenia metallireducens]SNY20983.1 hypothetical protein SAMN06265827_10675 [Orenia metallireducens]